MVFTEFGLSFTCLVEVDKGFFKFLGQNQILKPNRENVIAWRKKLKAEGKSSATINSYLIGSRRFFEFLEEQQIYPNIFKTVKGEKISSTHKKDNLTEEHPSFRVY